MKGSERPEKEHGTVTITGGHKEYGGEVSDLSPPSSTLRGSLLADIRAARIVDKRL
jgi:hypothetical protein